MVRLVAPPAESRFLTSLGMTRRSGSEWRASLPAVRCRIGCSVPNVIPEMDQQESVTRCLEIPSYPKCCVSLGYHSAWSAAYMAADLHAVRMRIVMLAEERLGCRWRVAREFSWAWK